ncbi:hypothetical protein KEM54_005142 [Ascosphaera aggregata]|nr:hypothetical protein KEM54_005142 [Ascosphaera aggregata]
MARVAAAQPVRSHTSPQRRLFARTARSQALRKDGPFAVDTKKTNLSAPKITSQPVNSKVAKPRSDRLAPSNHETKPPTTTTTTRGVRSAATTSSNGISSQKGKYEARLTAKKANGRTTTKPAVPSRLDQPTAASRARAVNARTMVRSGLRATTFIDSSLVDNQDPDDDEDELARPGVTTFRNPTVPTRVPAAATRPTAASQQRAKATVAKSKALSASSAQPKRNIRTARTADVNGKKVGSAAARNVKLTDISASRIAAKRGATPSGSTAPARNVTFAEMPNKADHYHSRRHRHHHQDGKGVPSTKAAQPDSVAKVIREAAKPSSSHTDSPKKNSNSTTRDDRQQGDGEDLTDESIEEDAVDTDHSAEFQNNLKRQSTSQGILASPAKRILPENLPKPEPHAIARKDADDDRWFSFVSGQNKPVLLSPARRPAAAVPSNSRAKRSPLLTLRDFASEDDDTQHSNCSPLRKAPLKHNFERASNISNPEPTLHGSMKFLQSPAKKSVARSLFGPVNPHHNHDDEPIALKPNSPLKRSPRKVHVQRPNESSMDTAHLNQSRLFGSPAKKCPINLFQQASLLYPNEVPPSKSPRSEDGDLEEEAQIPPARQSPTSDDVGYQEAEGTNEDRVADDQGIFDIFSPEKQNMQRLDVLTDRQTSTMVEEGKVDANEFAELLDTDNKIGSHLLDGSNGDTKRQKTQGADHPRLPSIEREVGTKVELQVPIEKIQEPVEVKQVSHEPVGITDEYKVVGKSTANGAMPGAFEQSSSPAAEEPQLQNYQESPLMRGTSAKLPIDHEERRSSNSADRMNMVPENAREESLIQANSESLPERQLPTRVDEDVIDWEDNESQQSLDCPTQGSRQRDVDHGAEVEVQYPSLPSPVPHTFTVIRDRQSYGNDDTDATEDECEGSDVDETTIHVNFKSNKALDMTGLAQQLSEWHGDGTHVGQPPSAVSILRSTDDRPKSPMRKIDARKSADPCMLTDIRITEAETLTNNMTLEYYRHKESRMSLPVMREFPLHRLPASSSTRSLSFGHNIIQDTPLSIKPGRFPSLGGSIERIRHQSTPVRGPFSPKPKAPVTLHNEDKENLQPSQHTSPPLSLSMSMTPTRLSAQGTPRVIHTICKVPLRKDDDDETGLIVPRKRSRHLSLTPVKPVRFNSHPAAAAAAAAAAADGGARVPLKPCDDNRSRREETASPVKEQSMPKRLRSKSPRRVSAVPKPPGILQDVVVFTDVHTAEGADASGIFIEVLEKMGAKCVRSWNWNPRASMSGTAVDDVEVDCRERKIGITHVVYKDGGLKTLEKIRQADGLVKCVGVAWVLDCEREGRRLNEDDYAVDTTHVPRGGNKRRKSMEPRRLSNVQGKLVKFEDSSSFPIKRSDETVLMKDTSDGLPTLTPSPANFRRRKSSRRDSMEWVKMQTGDINTAAEEEESDVVRTPNRRRSTATYDIESEEEKDSAMPTSAIGFDLNVAPSPYTPYNPLAFKSKLMQQTCPPKQKHARLFEDSPESEANAFQLRLEAARRKSLVWKPKVGSPLAR